MKHPHFVLALLCLALAACATPALPVAAIPAGAPVVPTGDPPAARPVASQSVASQPAATSVALGERELLLKRARSSGYKTRQKNGETVYCRDETPVGTHFAQVTCLSEEQTVTAMRNAGQTQDFMRTATGRCAGATCLNN